MDIAASNERFGLEAVEQQAVEFAGRLAESGCVGCYSWSVWV